MRPRGNRLLVDAREFGAGRRTGIGRVLEGLIDALAGSGPVGKLVLATEDPEALPAGLKGRAGIQSKKISGGFIRQERELSGLCRREFDLFMSPYRKLPLSTHGCRTIHMIHDVLDLTHPVYKKRLKVLFDVIRMKLALRKANLTWYDSLWSMNETRKLVGFPGRNPRVRYPGIDENFRKKRSNAGTPVLKKYGLEPGYALVIGNGLPHKNLGVLLRISGEMPRRLVFVGVSSKNKEFWNRNYQHADAAWIPHAPEEDLIAILSRAFCLAQPSTAEGYGYPPLEAMACGVPAVVSNIPVLIETTGGNAFYADPGNPKEWLEKFQALENRERYEEQAGKGLRWVAPFRGRKGWQKHLHDIVELIGG